MHHKILDDLYIMNVCIKWGMINNALSKWCLRYILILSVVFHFCGILRNNNCINNGTWITLYIYIRILLISDMTIKIIINIIIRRGQNVYDQLHVYLYVETWEYF